MMFSSRSKLFCYYLLTGFFFCGQHAFSQTFSPEITNTSYLEANRINPPDFDLPLHLPALLSGNFAEFRNNHFHSGLDFKTQGSQNHPVYAAADGWISRIRVSAYGFGYALYLDYQNGFTTVYGHLKEYAFPINSFAKKAQYEKEQFELDTLLKRGEIPVKRGQIIAYSGNSGGSAAPHLHFEIRDTKTEEPIDPLLWYSDRIKDKIAPRINYLALYAIEGAGVLSTGANKATINTVRTPPGNWSLKGVLPTVWGKIGLGLNAYDYMDQTTNKYGVCLVRLFLEDKEIFSQDLSRFSFDQTRYVNSMTDYEAWQKNKSWIMKSFIEPENRLNVYVLSKNQGYINVDTEKIYHFRYELRDRAGNISELRFDIQGEKRAIPTLKTGENRMEAWAPNHFIRSDLDLTIPAGALYNTIDFQYKQEPSDGYSDIYRLHNIYTPIHQYVPVRVKIQKDVLACKKAYYLAKQDSYGRFQYIGGIYSEGMMQANIREFGSYRVLADTIPPKIIGLNLENAVKNRLIRIRITDNASGIQTYRGTIDGTWVLFEYDAKTANLRYHFDSKLIKERKYHLLVIVVKDACGNESSFEHQFYY